MALAYIWGCFLVLFFITQTRSQDQPPKSPYDKLSEHYYYKCYNQTRDTKVFDKLYRDTIDLQKYMNYAFEFIPDQTKIFCKNERPQINMRITQVAKDLKPCLPEEEQFVAEFVESSFKEFLHFFCHHNAENIDRVFTKDLKAKQCRDNLGGDITSQLTPCFSRIFKPLAGHVTRKELCDDMTTAQKCLTQLLDNKCPQYNEYKQVNQDFFKYVNKPCSGCAHYLNILLLIVSLLTSYFFYLLNEQ